MPTFTPNADQLAAFDRDGYIMVSGLFDAEEVAGLLAVAILATSRPELRVQLTAYRREIADAVRLDRLS